MTQSQTTVLHFKRTDDCRNCCQHCLTSHLSPIVSVYEQYTARGDVSDISISSASPNLHFTNKPTKLHITIFSSLRTQPCQYTHNTSRQAVTEGSAGSCPWHMCRQHASQELDDVASVRSLDVQLRMAMCILDNLVTASWNGGIRSQSNNADSKNDCKTRTPQRQGTSLTENVT